MPESSAPDHDQRLKVLLKEFFGQFFHCFFPAWADRFDFPSVEWLDKELFLAPPQGEKRQLDLVAKLRLHPGAPPPCEGMTELVALVHVEVETRQSAVALRPRTSRTSRTVHLRWSAPDVYGEIRAARRMALT